MFARYLVKILAPMIGRPASAKRVRTLSYTYTLPHAQSQAAHYRGAAVWIEGVGAPATRPRR